MRQKYQRIKFRPTGMCLPFTNSFNSFAVSWQLTRQGFNLISVGTQLTNHSSKSFAVSPVFFCSRFGFRGTSPRVHPPMPPLEHRCITVHGPQMALAMVRGIKRVETRKRPLRLGWYSLHIGLKNLEAFLPEGPSLIERTWPDAPAASTLKKGCIIGRVYFDKVVSCEAAATAGHMWALCSSGSFSMVISKAQEFPAPILNVKGKQNV